jgi:hypothetical protein
MRAILTTVIECTITQKTGFAFDRGIDTHSPVSAGNRNNHHQSSITWVSKEGEWKFVLINTYRI